MCSSLQMQMQMQLQLQLQLQLLTRGEPDVIQDPPRCAAPADACCLCFVCPFGKALVANLHGIGNGFRIREARE